MEQGKGYDALKDVFDGLLSYTKEHFLTEESLMKLYHYPQYEQHREKHASMTNHVLKLVGQFEQGTLKHPIQITNFLKEWLGKHIMETDRKYGPFLNSKGVT